MSQLERIGALPCDCDECQLEDLTLVLLKYKDLSNHPTTYHEAKKICNKLLNDPPTGRIK